MDRNPSLLVMQSPELGRIFCVIIRVSFYDDTIGQKLDAGEWHSSTCMLMGSGIARLHTQISSSWISQGITPLRRSVPQRRYLHMFLEDYDPTLEFGRGLESLANFLLSRRICVQLKFSMAD